MSKISAMPEFTDAGTQAGVESPNAADTAANETDTREEAATPNKTAQENNQEGAIDAGSADVKPETQVADLAATIRGLQEVKRDLIQELGGLRGEKRELKQQEIDSVEQQIDTLGDVHPDDVALVDRVLKAKGYVPQSQINKMLYDARKQEELNKFLAEYPEYKEENDPDNKKWQNILQEVSMYKEPTDAAAYATILRRAHRSVSNTGAASSGASVQVKQHQARVASAGSGGSQRTSSVKLSMDKRMALLNGGFSDEDIKRLYES